MPHEHDHSVTAYPLVRPFPPSRLSEMCMWSRWRSVLEHVRFERHEEER
jgi:hypothetical protein